VVIFLVWAIGAPVQGPYSDVRLNVRLLDPATIHCQAMSDWFCEILGEQLGPMPWEDLVYLAERGNLRASHRVRRAAEGDWRCAREIAGLPLIGSERELVVVAEQDSAFEIGPGKRESLFEQLASSSAIVRSVSSPTPASAAPSRPLRGQRAPAPAVRRPESAGGVRLARSLLIALAIVGVAAAAWLGWNHRFTSGPPYGDVLRGYDLRYQELTGVRQRRPDARSSRAFAAKFKLGVASLRQRLTAPAADPVGEQLIAAGTLLDAMSQTAFSPAGSEGEAKYLQQERQFHDVLASAKTSLGER
jgi:hypothetical protein